MKILVKEEMVQNLLSSSAMNCIDYMVVIIMRLLKLQVMLWKIGQLKAFGKILLMVLSNLEKHIICKIFLWHISHGMTRLKISMPFILRKNLKNITLNMRLMKINL